MVYSGLENNKVNIKHGKLEIELAVQGWYLATNTRTTLKEIEKGLAFARAEGKSPDLEIRVDDTAYDVYGRIIDGKAIYYKGEHVMPTIPAEVVEEARKYLSKGKVAQNAFLKRFYSQVVLGEKGAYAEKFAEGKPETAAISNYFADEMRDFGLTDLAGIFLADILEAKIREAFPKQGINVYLVNTSP